MSIRDSTGRVRVTSGVPLSRFDSWRRFASAHATSIWSWPAEGREPIRFRVRLDGDPPGKARGIDVDERTLEITFLERGVEAYVFTFG